MEAVKTENNNLFSISPDFKHNSMKQKIPVKSMVNKKNFIAFIRYEHLIIYKGLFHLSTKIFAIISNWKT